MATGKPENRARPEVAVNGKEIRWEDAFKYHDFQHGDYADYVDRDGWTVDEAMELLLGTTRFDPNEKTDFRQWQPSEFHSSAQDPSPYFKEREERRHRLYDRVGRAIKAGRFHPLSRVDDDGTHWVRPADFILWAIENDFPIPRPLAPVLDSVAGKPGDTTPEAPEHGEPGRPGSEAPESKLDPNSFLTHSDLARAYGVPHDALKKRLERWRKNNLNGWQANENRRQNEAAYLYQVQAVLSIIEELQEKTSR